MLKPRIFVSAVSSEFASVRRGVAESLTRLGYEPVTQEIFGTESGDLRDVLRRKIDSCEGLIQIVGAGYGAEPPAADADFGRCSYTQFEFLYALHKGKKTWLIIPTDGYPRDKPAELLDLPRDLAAADPAAWQAERRALQDKYRRDWQASTHLWHQPASVPELMLAVERLRDELAVLRRRLSRWQRRVLQGLAAVLVLLAGVGGLVGWGHFRQRAESRAQQKAIEEVKAGQRVSAEKIRAHLLEAADHAHREALARADGIRDWQQRDKARDAADRARESAAARIDQLVADFAAIEGTAQATDLYNEMTRILSEDGVDAALAYLDRHRGGALDRARQRQEQTRSELRPLLEGARLKTINGKPAEARKDYQELLAADGNWPDLLDAFAWFLYDRAIDAKVNATLDASLADARQALDLAERLNAAPSPKPDWQRTLAATLTEIGDALVTRSGPGDGEAALGHYTRSLELAESLLKSNAGSGQAAQDVSASLERLGGFLAQRGQAGDADKVLAYYTRCQELLESLLKSNPGSGQAARDMSVSLDKLGDFLAQRGQAGDGDKALGYYTRSLGLAESLRKSNPGSGQAARDASLSLENLGDFLAQRGQAGDGDKALGYYMRSLDLRESLLKSNPGSGQAARDLSLSLNELGDFLARRGKAGDGDKALGYYTRSLEISESLLKSNPSSGQAVRDVMASLERLGDFLAQRSQAGDEDKTLGYFTRSLDLAESLLKSNPGSGQAARDVSLSLNELGDFLARRGQAGDGDKALGYYTRSLDLAESLLKLNPGSGQAARDASRSLENLGDFLAQRGQAGDGDKTLGYYTRSLEISESLLKSNPSSGQAVRDVVVSHLKLSAYFAKTGDADQARRHRRACCDVLRPRIAAGAEFDPPIMRLYDTLRQEFSGPPPGD